jgi:hypothetical protein
MTRPEIDLRDDDQLTAVYADVLFNLENAIHRVAYPDPDLGDGQVELVLERLIRHYQAEAAGRTPRPTRLSGATQNIFDETMGIAAFLLGETQLHDATTGEPVDIDMEPIDHEVLIACLKRIRKSVQFWHKRGGRRGYVTYLHGFLENGAEV